MQILEALWHGQINPAASENCCSAEYKDLAALYESNKRKLQESLDKSQLENLEKLTDVWEEMECLAEYSGFQKGFRLAVQLLVAAG